MLESQGRLEELRDHREGFRGFRDMLRNRREIDQFLNHATHGWRPCLRPGEIFQELNLDVSTEEFLSAERGFTCADLYAMLGNEDAVAWLTPHAAVKHNGRGLYYWEQVDERRFCLNVDGKAIYAVAGSPEHLSEIFDVVLRLLATSVVHSVELYNCILF
jgi:hypothetical protein